MSRKYYYVQLSSGVSQWETPTQAAPTVPTPGATPQQHVEHPYGHPNNQPRDLDIITNADGTQSIRHPDGRLEPYNGESDRGLGVSDILITHILDTRGKKADYKNSRLP